jgi:SPW repeat
VSDQENGLTPVAVLVDRDQFEKSLWLDDGHHRLRGFYGGIEETSPSRMARLVRRRAGRLDPGLPFMIEESIPGMVMLNAVVVGLVVTIVSQFQIFRPTAWEEIVNAACGLWMIASPLAFGYSSTGQVRFWHFVLGALVAGVAGIELWQDRQAKT